MTLPRCLIVRDPRFREHAPAGGHPECPERLDAIDAALGALPTGTAERRARPASDEELLRVHTREHVEHLKVLDGRRSQLDPDTYMAPGSHAAARLAAGAAIDVALEIAAGAAPRGLALLRPPGHHAEAGRAMGFCLFNNIALVTRALAAAGLERIAIVDWDVHHGNGTQHSFEAERDVLFISTHQFPFYPGSGALDERGVGAGAGATINLPLPAGADDAVYLAVFDRIVLPALHAFRPEMILVSAGYDAHAADPLASMQLSTQAYGAFTERLRGAADRLCEGRLLLLLEGGYQLDALGASVAESLVVLCAEETREPAPAPCPVADWERVVARLSEAHPKSPPRGTLRQDTGP